MSLNVTPEQRTLLDQVDIDLETAMSEGVSQGAVFLPALPQYDRVAPEVKSVGRQGILSTFAALIKSLFDFQQAPEPVTLVNGFANWPDGSFRTPQCYKSAGNEVGLTGLMRCPTIGASQVIGVLPVGCRPTQAVILTVVKNDTPVSMYVLPTGEMTLGTSCTDGQWISIDSRFRI